MNTLIINTDTGNTKISRHIYGHFAEHLGRCIYGGIWVGEDSSIPNTHGIRNDVVAALRAIKIPNLRWPGGCFADEYHWMDGIGPREQRPRLVNTHWGGVIENNHFGTHEFMDLCEQIDCAPYICGNLGSGTPQEMQQWVEYLTFDGASPMADLRRRNGREEPWKVPFWGVGNENWGCGGNMRPEYYSDEYRRFQTFVHNTPNNTITKIACGPHEDDYHWTEVMMKHTGGFFGGQLMQGLSLHYYTPDGPSRQSQSATKFGEEEWATILQKTLLMDELIIRHSSIMDRYDPEKKIGLIVDEWGTWYAVEPGTNPGFLYQQNSMRDAIVAALNLHLFNKHCERVKMANIAQMINVLQALILTEEGGERMILTPTYHVFEMFKVHQEATLLPLDLQSEEYRYGEHALPTVSASASKADDGQIHLTLCNTNPREAASIRCELRGASVGQASGRVLTADQMQAHNTFDAPDTVHPVAFTDLQLEGNQLTCTLPPMSVVVIALT